MYQEHLWESGGGAVAGPRPPNSSCTVNVLVKRSPQNLCKSYGVFGFVLSCFNLLDFQTESHLVAQAGIELTV